MLTGNEIFRDYETAGVPSSGKHKPKKSEIRTWASWVESLLGAVGSNSGVGYETRALLFADLSKGANTLAWVTNDPTVAYNGIYEKIGPAGVGAWIRVADLPYSFIIADDAGAGTPNAIQATTTIPVSSSALVLLNIFEPNTGSPVTISFNGGPPLTIKTNSGNDPVAGGIVGSLMGIVSGSVFRLFSDQASAAVVAAAEAAAASAAAYAALARNDFYWRDFTGNGATTSFDLAVDPGSANNVFAFVEGIRQTNFSLSGTVITFDAAPPAPSPGGKAKNVEFAFGYRTTVGTPADGSVTGPKIGAGAVSPDKMAQVLGVRNAVLNPRFLCNTRAVSGTVTLAAGARGHDCWKAGASGCTYTFTKTGNRTVITISAGSLQQVIPGDDLETGNYFLSWTGTAQGRINGGAYGASGVPSAAMTGGTNATIEFNTGTLSYPQFELGYVTKFDLRPLGEERNRVERWVRKIFFLVSGYASAAAQDIYGVVNYPAMAAAPTATIVGSATLTNGTNPGPASANDNYYQAFVRSAAAGQSYISATYLLSCEL